MLSIVATNESRIRRDNCNSKQHKLANSDSIGYNSNEIGENVYNLFFFPFQTDLLLGLPHLRHLDRGDFLADVIEHLHHQQIENPPENNMPTSTNNKRLIERIPSLKIQEFWASEEYFFHSEEQMELVSKYCPDIKQMLFMFQNTECTGLSVLANFTNLEDLDLWGGAFYTDGLCDLLEDIGT